MSIKVFIDGREGTTGLRINERMAVRDDVELLSIDPELRKDPEERRKLINSADVAFLCLPDAAATMITFASSILPRHTEPIRSGPMASRSLEKSSVTRSKTARELPFPDAMLPAS